MAGCERPTYGRGFCNPHYQRWRKNGHPGEAFVAVRVIPSRGLDFLEPSERRPGLCLVRECGRPVVARDLCNTHYNRWWRGVDLGAGRALATIDGPSSTCSVEGCERPVRTRGWCDGHYRRWRDRGAVGGLIKARVPKIDGNVRKDGYRWIRVNTREVPEHRHLMELALGRKLLPGETVHHRNGIRTDNRLENLELRGGNHGQGQATEDLVAWAVELLGRYAPELLAPNAQRLAPLLNQPTA